MGELVVSMFNEIFGGGLFDSVKKILTENPTTTYPDAMKIIEKVYDTYMVPIGIGITIILFAVKFIEKSSSENFNFDQLFLLGTKLIAAVYLINNGLEIITMLWGWGIGLINQIASGSGGSIKTGRLIDEATLKSIYNNLTGETYPNEPGVLKSIGVICQLLVPWLAALVMKGVASFLCYSRLIEMMLRAMAAPIAFGDFFSEGLHGAGWRFLKNFMAIALQGALIYLICVLFSSIISSMFDPASGDSFMTVVVKYFVFCFSAVALMFKSLSLSKELLGSS